jgi:hypothetical protein
VKSPSAGYAASLLGPMIPWSPTTSSRELKAERLREAICEPLIHLVTRDEEQVRQCRRGRGEAPKRTRLTRNPGSRETNFHARARKLIAKKTHKRCPHCRRWLPFEAFSVNRRLKSGRSSWCLECARTATQRWRAANAEILAEKNAARRLGERVREVRRVPRSLHLQARLCGSLPRLPAPAQARAATPATPAASSQWISVENGSGRARMLARRFR